MTPSSTLTHTAVFQIAATVTLQKTPVMCCILPSIRLDKPRKTTKLHCQDSLRMTSPLF